MTIGERIRNRRLELSMTQEEFAHALGLSAKSTVCKLETQGDNITTDRIKKIAKVLDCTPAYLMGWENNTDETEVPTYQKEHIQLIHMFSKLTPEQQQIILNTMSAFLSGNK